MKNYFVLIDFENIQPENLSRLKGSSFKVKVFLGANQSKIPAEIARALQPLGPDAEYIQIDGSGRNALDFHIAYYIGRLSVETPGAVICVISKDSGFDPLIKHLKAKGILCTRCKSIAEIPLIAVSSSKSIPARIDAVIENLMKRKAAKPRTLQTLRSTIKASFAPQLSDEELDGLIEELTSRGVIKVSDGKIQYELPT